MRSSDGVVPLDAELPGYTHHKGIAQPTHGKTGSTGNYVR